MKTATEFFKAFNSKNYVVFDTETSLIGDKSIYVDMPEFICGVAIEANHFAPYHWDSLFYMHTFIKGFIKSSSHIIVGHNLPFDLLQAGTHYQASSDKAIYWDTAIAEYVITGQEHTFPSLQDLADKYCPGETKDETVSEMIKAGIQPKDIPQEQLFKYCEQDVLLTKKIFEAQIKYLTDTSGLGVKFFNTVLQSIQFRINTHYMSMNGMYMDKQTLYDASNDVYNKMKTLEVKLKHEMNKKMPFIPANDCNPDSPKQLSLCMYGGLYEHTLKVPQGTYKTGPNKGSIKYKNETARTPVKNPVFPTTGISSVDEATLKSLPIKDPFIDMILEYREYTKEYSTYFEGYRKAGKETDSHIILGTEYKHCITPTGRISSTKPNLQNLKRD